MPSLVSLKMAASSGVFVELRTKFEHLLRNPEEFLRPQKKLADDLKVYTKQLYDLSKSNEIINIPASVALPKLIISGFDDEQIWQELELQNNACNGHFIKVISKLLNCNKKDSEDVTFHDLQTRGLDDDGEELSEASSIEQSEPDVDDSGDEDFKKLKTISILHDDDDDVMSDISIELEKALDKRIALDKEIADLSDASVVDDNGDEDNDGDKEYQENSESDARENSSRKIEKPKFRTTIVDDKFFKLFELEQFLEKEDAKEERRLRKLDTSTDKDDLGEDDEFDYFQDIPSDEEEDNDDEDDDDDDDGDEDDQPSQKIKSGRKVKYADFFDQPEGKPKRFGKRKLSSDEEDNRDNEEKFGQSDSISGSNEENQGMQKTKSAFEIRQEKLKEKIKALEESNLSEKPWQLMGEASVAIRPENSLLEEHLQFDHMTRQAPLITEETMEKLENIIIRRIKDQSWDDVERKIKPKEQPFEYKKRLVLDQEKSKLSLAEVYEQEYLKQQKGEKMEEEEPEEHKEIRKTMALLFTKLDALSNFHFVPKPSAPELKIVNNLPAIVVEEVAPVSASDAALLAPEEIKEKAKGELTGKTERSDTDRKRERREKKSAQKKRRIRKEAHKKMVDALNPGLGNKYSKEAALKKLQEEGKVTLTDKDTKFSKKKSSLTSSKSFFTQLQEEVQTSIQLKKSQLNKKKAEKQASALKLKL